MQWKNTFKFSLLYISEGNNMSKLVLRLIQSLGFHGLLQIFNLFQHQSTSFNGIFEFNNHDNHAKTDLFL